MKKAIAITLLMVLAACGCATVGKRIDPGAVRQLKTGATTQKDAIALLGPPDSMTQVGSGGSTWMYVHVRATTKASSFIPVIGSFAGGTKTSSQCLTLSFGPDGILTDFINSTDSMDVGVGLDAVQTGERGSATEAKDEVVR